jgi:hypothetical protein
MIHYALRCADSHEFDGWFKNSTSFEAQAAAGLLDCPICGDRRVQRALMAPHVQTGSIAVAAAPPQDQRAVAVQPPGRPTVEQGMAVRAASLPDEVRAVLQRVRAEVEATCDYVGPRFAAEARRIHGGEAADRHIFGEATPDEAAALADDGIDVARIPWVPRADS